MFTNEMILTAAIRKLSKKILDCPLASLKEAGLIQAINYLKAERSFYIQSK